MGKHLGSVGAGLFFVAFAAIAWFVYRESLQQGDDPIRHAAPLVVDESAALPPAPPKPPPKPKEPAVAAWRRLLDPRQARLVQAAPAAPERAPGENKGPNDGGKNKPGKPGKPGKAKSGKPGQAKRAQPQALVQTLPSKEQMLLTLDPELQAKMLALFAEKELPYAGAVLLDLRDQSVLVAAGYSAADPKVNPMDILTTPWSPAASTFKVITAAELIEQGHARPETRVCFHGGLSGITDALLDDNPKLDKRCETLTDAVAHSHNVIIAKLALRHMGRKDVVRAARRFRYEQDIPFEVPIEPSPIDIPEQGKARAKVAAGFWHIDESPMHAAVIASIFARKGMYQAPHIVAQRLLPDGKPVWPKLPAPERVISAKTAKAVGAMMVHTTTRGTAKTSFRGRRGSLTPGLVVAGKTGALTGKRPPNYNYNWLIGFAPAQKPQIAFAVVLANPPKWRIKAHYAARLLVQAYWAKRRAIQTRPGLTLTPAGLVAGPKPVPGRETQALKPVKHGPLRTASHGDAVAPLPGASPRAFREPG